MSAPATMATAAPRAAGVSAFTAAEDALAHTRRALFPFRLERWLALGFVAFLEQCGRQGGGFNPNIVPPGREGGDGGGIAGPVEWAAAHLTLVVAVATVVLAVIVAVIALVLWVNSRAIFMYVDDVATGRADVARPWREHAERAGSLFAWRFGLTLATLGGVLVLLVLGALAVARGVARGFGGGVVVSIVVLGLALLLLLLLSALLAFALRDFVAPLQWHGALSCGAALRVFAGLLSAHLGTFLVFVLLRIVFAIALGMALLLLGCLTCCIGFLPVVSQTVLQPAFFFERAWSLQLLRQLGYDLFTPSGGGAAIAEAP
jgi:hypothetical protein